MSKFFNATSESESESEQEEEIVQNKPVYKAYQFDSDEEDVKTRKVVLPEKEKRTQELNNLIKQLKNAKNIRDIAKCAEIFEELVKAYDKCKKLVEKDGHFKQYIRCLGEFSTYIEALRKDTEWCAQASKNNSVALKKLKQRMNKYYKGFEAEIEDFNKNPNNYPEEDKVEVPSASEGESDEESSDEESGAEGAAPAAKPAKPAKKQPVAAGSDDEDDESDMSFSSDESSDDDSSSIDLTVEGVDLLKQFLKKKSTGAEEVKKKDKDKVKHVKQRQQVKDEEASDADDKESLAAAPPQRQLFAKDEEINLENVVKKLNEICSARGRKGTDRHEQIDILTELKELGRKHNLGQALEVKILFNLIAMNFDYNPKLSKCMKSSSWNRCLKMVEELLQIQVSNDDIQTGENILEESESLAEAPFRVKGCALTMVDRMCEEFVKILQNCDAHGSEYVDRLKDEPKVCAIVDTLQGYLERKGTTQEICRVYLKKVENIYYKYDKDNANKSVEVMDKLCKFIYTQDNTDRIRTQAMLCHIYHNALHNRWYEARDLMLMSHLQESIDHADIPLQILYNRTMVQVGLCAFRAGNIRESHAALLDIQSGNRAKELLAQGMMVQRNVEKTKEQESKERQRLIPFHMHINLELLECLYLVSAMLIEIPYMCSRDYETKKRMISKQFHFQMKLSEKQPVVGPPENMREHVVAAARAMRNGDWRSCLNYLINEKMTAKVWDLIPDSASVRAMLTDKVKEETLRSYLFKYSSVYESINISNLAEMFELPKSQVYSSISKMIINEELMASLDEPTETVVMHRTEPTRLQTLALQLSEKINTLMDHTERISQLKSGEMGAQFNRQQGQQGQQNQQNNNYKQQNWKNSGNKGNKNQNRQRNPNQQHQNKHHNNQHHQRGEHHHHQQQREQREPHQQQQQQQERYQN